MRKHDEVGYDCWCRPTLEIVCNECDGDGCWRCDDGFVQITVEQARITVHDVLIIHSEEAP